MKKLIIFGTTHFADVAHYYFSHDSQYLVTAFLVDTNFASASNHLGLPIITTDEFERNCSPEEYCIFLAIGYSSLNLSRKKKYEYFKSHGYSFASYVSSKASVFSEYIGEHVFILENNVIQPYAEIGNNVILWSGNHIGHHTKIGNHSFVSSHVVIGGATHVGEQCFIGVNVTVGDHINIGDKCLLGAGSMILKNTQPNEVYIASQTPRAPISSDRVNLP